MSSALQWYWHRLRAMSAREMLQHARKKALQIIDGRRERDWASIPLQSSAVFPHLPLSGAAPEELRTALRHDVESILRGHWKAFGHLEIQVADPPKWHCDYLVGKNFATDRGAFHLNHRALPEGADIKLIWELSRWYPLVRLAQAAWVLDDERAARKCIAWLEDWVTHNPPYRGWNWTSALEAGMRLIQFTWIDALLQRGTGVAPDSDFSGSDNGDRGDACPTGEAELDTLRYEILPAHAWFTWRHKSFGSSANNHLLGELAGLIVATARWPALAHWGAPMETLQALWEREVLAQFAEDGGNKEQALNYQLFSWEFCWQSRLALVAAGRKVSPSVEERLVAAARFFREVQVRREPWDYGDSDNAFVTPFFASEHSAIREWCGWIDHRNDSAALDYWLGDSPISQPPEAGEPEHTTPVGPWWIFERTGLAISELGFWFLRWDLSPLGYLRTGAHGHLDALHLSIWRNGVAIVVDPGTGAYFADPPLRSWLASRAAHNAPCPAGEEYPKRLGPFLWSEHHARPRWTRGRDESGSRGLTGELTLPDAVLRRCVTRLESGDGWQVLDEATTQAGGGSDFAVRWQFAPQVHIKVVGERTFAVHRADVSVLVEIGREWAEVQLVEDQESARSSGDHPLAGTVSPAFRKTCFAPYLLLTARGGDKPCVFRTTFLASPRS